MDKIRVLLVDDHALVRECISMMLEEEGVEVVGGAEDAASGLEKVATLQPNVVLMDISMPGMNGIEATRLVKVRHPEVQVLILAGATNEQTFYHALEAGASGYVLKTSSSEELVSAVRAVANGGVFLQPPVTRKLMRDYLVRQPSNQSQDGWSTLTGREREVLRLMAEGYTKQEIAELLTISPNTAQTHRVRIMEKLNLRTRAELVKYALCKGILSPSGQA